MQQLYQISNWCDFEWRSHAAELRLVRPRVLFAMSRQSFLTFSFRHLIRPFLQANKNFSNWMTVNGNNDAHSMAIVESSSLAAYYKVCNINDNSNRFVIDLRAFRRVELQLKVLSEDDRRTNCRLSSIVCRARTTNRSLRFTTESERMTYCPYLESRVFLEKHFLPLKAVVSHSLRACKWTLASREGNDSAGLNRFGFDELIELNSLSIRLGVLGDTQFIIIFRVAARLASFIGLLVWKSHGFIRAIKQRL